MLLRREDTAELIFSILAVHAIGAIAVPTYTQLRTPDLVYRINDSGAKVAIVDAALLAEAEPLLNECVSFSDLVVAPADPTDRFVSLDSLLEDDAPRVDYADTHADDVALILYTSGSTGHPKATCHNHSDLLATADTYADYCIGMRPGAWSPARRDPVRARARLLRALHVAIGSVSRARCRQDTATADRGDGRVRRHHRRRGFDLLQSAGPAHLRARIEAAQAANGAVRRRALADRGRTRLGERDRRTARAVPGHDRASEYFHRRPTWRGRGQARGNGPSGPGLRNLIRDADTFAPVPSGTAGLLCVRGPTGTHYLNNAEAQAKTVRDGWNVFQDLVAWDEDGCLIYIARRDEMIVSGGHSISPVEVEQVLMRHPYVAECACTAAPDPAGLRPSIVKAYIVLKSTVEQSATTKLELQGFFKRSAPPFMYPREIEFKDLLPRTLNGKIQRSELRRLAAQAAAT